MLQIVFAKLIHAHDIRCKRYRGLWCTWHFPLSGSSWKGFSVSSERAAFFLCAVDAPEIMKQTPFVGRLVCLQVLSHYKPVLHVFVHEAFVLVPKDALSEKKERGQMAGTLFTAPGAIVELPCQRTATLAAPSCRK